MAGNITPTNQFAAQSGPIPLSQLDTNFNQSATQLNSLGTFSNFYADTGTTNTWIVTITSPQIVAYTAGLNIQVKVANAITGAATLNINGLGAKAVTNPDASALTAGQVVAGAIVDLYYDGTQFQINGGTQGASGNVPTSRQILTTAPLTGGGDLTANRTLAVNTFGAAQSGVVPNSGGGTTNFLRADGTWAAPPGATSGTVTSIATTAPLTGGTITTNGTLGVSTFGAGASGVVPASGGGTTNFLRADGNWSPAYISGTFTATWLGFSSAPGTTTLSYSRTGHLVTIYLPSQAGTSNATNFQFQGLPASIQPSVIANVTVSCPGLYDNGSGVATASCAQIGGITVSFFKDAAGALWTSSGQKGFNSPIALTYGIL